MSAQRAILEVRGLTVDYRRRGQPRLRAVDALDMTLHAGHTLALVGESGSGKSTVVRALARFVRPAAGEILLRGAAARRRPSAVRAYRRSVQVVFQDPFASLNPMHTVGYHLRRPVALHNRGLRGADLDARVLALLESVNLTPAADIAAKRPHELSGGQRQRVAIARALATSPQVLLADEPVSMLDVSIRLEILNLLQSMQADRDLALLYVTHDLATARHFADDIMVMYRGTIVERGPSDAVILAPAHPYTQLLAAAAPGGSRARPAGNRRAGRQGVAAPGGCAFRTRCPHAMAICEEPPPEFPAGAGQTARCWLRDPARAAAPAGSG